MNDTNIDLEFDQVTVADLVVDAISDGLGTAVRAAVLVLAYVGAATMWPDLRIIDRPDWLTIAAVAGGIGAVYAIAQATESILRLAAWRRRRPAGGETS